MDQTPNTEDGKSLYEECCKSASSKNEVLFQNVMKLEKADSLFYTDVLVKGQVSLRALLDSGSMACTINEEAEQKLKSSGITLELSKIHSDIMLIGCGGVQVRPKCIYEIEMEVYGHAVNVPTLVVPGQRDEVILGTNVIKYILSRLKETPNYWRVLNMAESSGEPEIEHFLDMLSGLHRWKGKEIPDALGTAKLMQAVTLLPRQEHLVWAKLPATAAVSVGSAILVEPPKSQTHKKNVMVGRVVTSMNAERWVPVRILNPSNKPVTLKRNSKVADVSPCLALEDLDVKSNQSASNKVTVSSQKVDSPTADSSQVAPGFRDRMDQLGLGDLDVDSCEVTTYWKEQLVQLIQKYEGVFSKDKLDCGKAKDFYHRIRLSDDRPFRLPYRRVPPAHYHKLRQVLSEMEEREIIRKSSSEWASPIVLVWKKNGDLRICVDYRWLNSRTVKDAHPLPHQADCLAALGGNAIFSAMDLTSGFYNIEMAEEDKKFTAFTTPMGLYEMNRLPQGLCNSPASFMRLMMGIFGDQNFLSLLCYLDDVLVYAPNEGEALKRLEMVFARLSAHGLKLAPKKCHLLRRRVRFLGHIIDENGVATDPDKVKAITAMTEADLMMEDGVSPSQRKIKAFLGMIMYYQRFIPNCSSIAKPLFSLTAAPKGRKVNRKGAAAFRKLRPDDWKQEHSESFAQLKSALLESVVLAHPDFSRPFILSTDASLDGLGAVLSQVPEGETKARPIAFASKALTRAQINYPAHRLEFLALKWSVCDKFSHWLKGNSFTVWTDNNPLTYILTKPKLDACEQRWVAKLAPYNFSIQYIPGSKNVVADALSRQPFTRSCVSQRLVAEPYKALLEEAEHYKEDVVQRTFVASTQCQAVEPLSPHQELACCSLSSEEVSAIMNGQTEWSVGFKAKVGLLSQDVLSLVAPGQSELSALSLTELQDKQQEDPVLSRVLSYVTRGTRPSRRERAKETFRALKTLKQWNKLKVLDGILYRLCKDPLSGKKRYQYVVPASLIKQVLQGIHDDAGHQGQYRTLYLARQRFFWVDMEREIREYVQRCKRCVVSKTPEPEGRAPLESVRTTRPLELACIDFWSAEDSQGKSVDVLVVTDHFTKLAHSFVCRDQSAKQVARQLWDRVFCLYGFPERIHADQGANFESHLIQELLQIAGVNKSRTTSYHPMGNGHVERFNRTLGSMIRTLPPRAKQKWPQMLQTLTFVYNCTAHESTGYAPFFLMFGRTPRLPVDVVFHNVGRDSDIVDYNSYVNSMRADLKEAAALAQASADVSRQRQTELYNRRMKGCDIEEGDRILLANKGERGRRKLADKWESTPYVVVSKDPKCHTYRVRNTNTGQEKVVHRNLMLQVNFLPFDTDAGVEPSFDDSESSREQAQGSSMSSLESEEVSDKEDRTASWIATLGGTSIPSGSSCTSECGEMERRLSTVDLESTSSHPQRSTTDILSAAPTETARANTEKSQEHSSKVSIENVDPPVTGIVTQVKTRAGRLVKPVNRLIQSMTQKVAHHSARDLAKSLLS
uniref:Gypsy retrotransposon integrase-like protein 1 n=1 Tax=Astyanax mexicanus TaxID=7994 RepID=A0A3B1JBI6_ASTMX